MKYFNKLSAKKLADKKMHRKTENITPPKKSWFLLLPALFISPLLLTACGGDDNGVARAPTPTEPANYQQDSSGEVGGLLAFYDFEDSLSDASGNSGDAKAIGININDMDSGSVNFNGSEGMHPLSSAAEFNGVSGLMLPNLIYSPSYSVSMWVKPESSDFGPIFYAKSDLGWLLLDSKGLTAGGATGQGKDDGDDEEDWPITYTGEDYNIPAGEYTHVVFSVEYGKVDLYINGVRVFEAGDYVGLDVFGGEDTEDTSDDWIVEDDAFNDLFNGQSTVVALGVSANTDVGEDAVKPFKGLIDNVRIYNEPIYYVNVIVLSDEVLNEGPAATIDPVLAEGDITVNWVFDRIDVTSIDVSRESFEDELSVNLTEGASLGGEEVSFNDLAVPIGKNYRYTVSATTERGQIFSPVSDYIRVPGDEPYAAVSASLNEDTENIELSFSVENITATSYEVLRNIEAELSTAESIATGITEASYIDVVNDEESPLAPGTPYFYWVSVTGDDTAVTTSLALPTASATAAGEFVPLNVFVLEENQDGFCNVDGAVESNNAGFSGEGFANTDNVLGARVLWKVNFLEAGEYAVIVRFANGDTVGRPGDLSIGGVRVASLALDATGGWTTYEESIRYPVNVEAGEQDVILTATVEGKGLANIDYIKFVPTNDSTPAPEGVACAQ